jgi:uncharacterized protein (TIGR03437 family)
MVRGLDSPVDITHAGDGSGRLFVLEQRGRVRLIRNGALVTAPVLDIVARVQFGGEMGLLGIAFPPGFASKQYFYVNYVDRQRRTIISRFRIQGDTADPASEQVLLTIPQPYENHNGGQIRFGPDGYLYIGMGDGGSGGDPQKFAQNRNSLLGKMLRIDTESGTAPYAIPASNPPGQRREIWALGLRNPWRFSFDRETGDLYIADVGQNTLEEVNFQSANSAGGENYGWSIMEGTRCFDDPNCANRSELVRPIFDYGRNEGVSVTGGFVYRGSRYPFLRGVYIFGDFGSSLVLALRRQGNQWQANRYGRTGFSISTFGEDEQGELYAGDYGGRILLMEATAPAFATPAVVSGASFTPGIVPGGLASLFIEALPGVTGTTSASAFPLPTTLSGVTVRINNQPAPLYAVTPQQVNFFVPWTVTGTTAAVTVTSGATTSPETQVPVNSWNPGLFLIDGRAAAQNSEGYTLVTPQNAMPRGGVVVLYGTGFGPVSNAPANGAAALADPISRVNERVDVSIGGRPAQVLFAGLTPGAAGLYQLNVLVPADAPTGEVDVIVTVGGVRSPAARLSLR